MSFNQRIQEHFNESLQTNMMIADSLHQDITLIAEQLIQTILKGHKILIGSNASASSHANYFANLLIHGFNIERPSLPAISLSCNVAMRSSIAFDEQFTSIFTRQIQALGQAQDIFLLFSIDGEEKYLIDAIEAAKEKNMRIISITGKDGGKIHQMLHDNDAGMCIPSANKARILESQLSIIHCLSDLIDRGIFGA